MNTKKDITLLEALGQQFPESSKNTLREWIRSGRVSINSAIERDMRSIITPEDIVRLEGQRLKWEEKVKIIFEDESLVVIHKPAGLLSVATNFEKSKTAHAVLKRRYPRKKVFVIHRLDQETSGLMVFARTWEAYSFLKQELAARRMRRTYSAVVEGRLEGEGSWTSYLQEDAAYYVHVSKDPRKGERAVTHYETRKVGRRFSYVTFKLETGKKNQIRVQAAEAGHPVAGDEKYGAKQNPFRRLALHAARLEFIHPITKKELFFEDSAPSEWQKIP